MLENNQIKPKGNIPDKDKERITLAVRYLNNMNYIDQVSYLPDRFDFYKHFRVTFGFDEYQDPGIINEGQYVYVGLEQPAIIKIAGADYFVQTGINIPHDRNDEAFDIEKETKQYTLLKDFNNDKVDIKLMNNKNEELLVFNTEEIFEKFADFHGGKEFISVEEATFTEENEKAKLTIIVQNLDMQNETSQTYQNAVVYVFVQVK